MSDPAVPSVRDRLEPRTFLALLAAGLVGVLAVLPYQFALVGWPSADVLPLVLAAALAQNAILIGLVVLVGQVLGTAVGFRVVAPDSSPVATYGRAVAVGLGAGVAILILDAVVFAPLIREAVLGGAVLPVQPGRGEAAWLGLLASLYGGITEELLLRFGLMSLLAWIGWRLVGRPADLPAGVAWGSIVLAALLFGLGHLPVTATLFELTPAVLVRMLVLNGIGGVAFGWLYWRHDLVAAMAAHFAADLVLHVVAVFPA